MRGGPGWAGVLVPCLLHALALSLCLLWAWTAAANAHSFSVDAPNTARVLERELTQEPFTSAVHACFPNASSSFKEFSGEAPPQSQCLLNAEPMAEVVKTLGKSLAREESAQLELERLSQGVFTPQILFDLDSFSAGFRTFLSVFYGGNHFRLGQDPGDLRPQLWIPPSPIGRINSKADNPGPNIILGQSCSDTNAQGIEALQLEPDMDKNREATGGRRLMESRSTTRVNNITDLIVSARVLHSGPTRVTGVGEIRDQRQWENVVGREIMDLTDQTSPGPPYPRTHMLLFYRADWFAALNIKVPDTWDELISLAEALPRLSGFQGSYRAAGPEDVPNWNLDAWPDVESLPVEPVEIFQELPLNRSAPQGNAGSSARYPLCIDLAPYCMGGWLFNAILASLAQSLGTWQGAFIDPITTELLGSTEPVLVEEALKIFSRLTRTAAHQPSSIHSCAAVNHMFASGACAMTLNWDLFFPYVYNEPVLSGAKTEKSSPYAQELVGKVGVAPLPGSTCVYDRSTASIVDCDEAACPLATKHTVAEYAGPRGLDGQQRQQQGAPSSSADLGTWDAAGVSVVNTAVLVNRAPYSTDAMEDLFFCNQRRDQSGATLPGLNIPALDATSRVLNGVYLPLMNCELLRSKVLQAALEAMGHNVTLHAYKLISKHDVTGLDGLYQVHPSLATPPRFSPEALESWWYPNTTEPILGLSALSGMFIDIKDGQRYFEALWKARYSYRNQAPDLWSTRTLNLAYRHASEELSVYTVALPDFSLEAATQGFQKRCREARASESESKDIVQAATWYTTGFDEGMIDKDEGEDRDWVAGAIAGPVVAFVLLVSIALALFLIIRSKNKRHNWLGQVKAPPAAAETTLLNTDIEGSTRMWETLPETICDRALTLHNDIIRAVLAKYKGYECGTEGDAFLLAFYSASEAVSFATEAQLLLMLAPWPEELLELDLCQPAYVHPFTATPTLVSQPSQEKREQRRSDQVGKSSTLGSSSQQRSQGDLLDSMEMGNSEAVAAPDTTWSAPPADAIAEEPTRRSLYAKLRFKMQKALEVLSKSGRERRTLHSTSEYLIHRSFTLKGVRSRSAQAGSESLEPEKRLIGLSGVLSLDTAVMEAYITSSDDGKGATSRKGSLQKAPSDGIKTSFPTDSTVCVDLDRLHGTTGADKSIPQISGPASATQVTSVGQILLNGLTVGQKLQSSMPTVDGPGEGRLLVMRGLRVRMGVASGVDRPEDMSLNTALGRMEYRGRAMESAKAVVDTAQGGQILITPGTFRQLPGGALVGKALVASMGDHTLEEGQATSVHQLYQVLPYLLCARAAYLGPGIKSQRQLTLGFMEAPADVATICFMSVAYLDALQLWNPAVASASLDLWRSITQGILAKKGGYLSEGVGGLCVAAFNRPVAALRWALESLEACLHADWPEELLQTEFGEESSIAQPSTPSRQDSGLPVKSHSFSAENESQKSVIMEERLVFRGLRIKVGIDVGSVKADLHPATARIAYRGKVMNRAARIGGVAKSGQVLCSEAAWKSAIRELSATDSKAPDLDEKGVKDSASKEAVARPIGPHKLKGIQEMINIYQCI